MFDEMGEKWFFMTENKTPKSTHAHTIIQSIYTKVNEDGMGANRWLIDCVWELLTSVHFYDKNFRLDVVNRTEIIHIDSHVRVEQK